jgi:hypothetical protein
MPAPCNLLYPCCHSHISSRTGLKTYETFLCLRMTYLPCLLPYMFIRINLASAQSAYSWPQSMMTTSVRGVPSVLPARSSATRGTPGHAVMHGIAQAAGTP